MVSSMPISTFANSLRNITLISHPSYIFFVHLVFYFFAAKLKIPLDFTFAG